VCNVITDHISSDEVEGEDDASIQQQKLPQTTRAFRQTSIGSIVSSDVDSSIISEPNRRLSAFAAVSKNMQSQQTVRLGTSSSGSSTISEHTSAFKEQVRLYTFVLLIFTWFALSVFNKLCFM